MPTEWLYWVWAVIVGLIALYSLIGAAYLGAEWVVLRVRRAFRGSPKPPAQKP